MIFLGEVNINLLSENDVETYEVVWFRVDDKIKVAHSVELLQSVPLLICEKNKFQSEEK